uniref:Uncharacterized protein n=1 Tax=Aegilops tauschii subsp. strangulata TaxID=200361 RepID=A0A453D9H0_AEGTS
MHTVHISNVPRHIQFSKAANQSYFPAVTAVEKKSVSPLTCSRSSGIALAPPSSTHLPRTVAPTQPPVPLPLPLPLLIPNQSGLPRSIFLVHKSAIGTRRRLQGRHPCQIGAC